MNQPNKIQNYVFSYHFWLQFYGEVMDRFDQIVMADKMNTTPRMTHALENTHRYTE